MTLHEQHVCANEYVDECVAAFAAEAKGKGVKLQIMDVGDLGSEGDEGAANILDTSNTANQQSNNHRESKFMIQTIFPGISVVPLQLTDSYTVYIDRHKMDQVLRNLISNALKFSSEGEWIVESAEST